MTVIVAVKSEGRVIMGSDSQAGNGGAKITVGSKLIRVGPMLVGCSGSTSLSDFFRYSLVVDSSDFPLKTVLSHCVVPTLRRYLHEHDLMEKHDRGSEFPGICLCALRDEIAVLDGTGGIVLVAGSSWAIGSGCGEARGAMHVSSLMGHPAYFTAEQAVAAAIALDDGCGPPSHLEWTTP